MQQVPLTETVFYILLVLHSPNHGYGITQEVERLTEGRVRIGAGTLYGALQTMLKKGWIRVYSEQETSRKKKEYVLTDEGKEAFEAEVARMKDALRNAEEVRDG